MSLSLVVLNTFVHRDAELAAPLLPEIFLVVSRLAASPLYSWEQEGAMTIIPGNPRSVARQFLRVTLHQLSANGLFALLFKLDLEPEQRARFFATIVSCLNDFSDMSPTGPLQLFFEHVSGGGSSGLKQSLDELLSTSLPNLIAYLSAIQVDHITNWSAVFPPLEAFYRNISLLTSSQQDGVGASAMGVSAKETGGGKEAKEPHQGKSIKLANIEPVLKLIIHTMKMPGIGVHRSILEPIIKIVSFAIQFCTFKFPDLVDICFFCNKAFTKERDKNAITRSVVAEFVQSLKYKTAIPDVNLVYLASLVLQDAKGELPPSTIFDRTATATTGADGATGATTGGSVDLGMAGPAQHTGATEVMRLHLMDIVDFILDVHTLSKVKSNVRGTSLSLNQDTLGGLLKGALSQFLALEIARLSGERDVKAVSKFLPWLFNPPNTIATQAPKEFLDCVSHIRMLSWLLLGAVNYTLLAGCREGRTCQPIPLEASCHIADHVEVKWPQISKNFMQGKFLVK